MWKYLVVFALIFGLAIYVSVQDEHAAQEATQKTSTLNKNTVSAAPNENHPKQDIENAERNQPGWYGFFRWPGGTTTWAVIFTLLAIAEQVKVGSDATKAMRDSIPHQENAAKAAEESANALINAERPWIIASIKKEEHHSPRVFSTGDEISIPPPTAFGEESSFALVLKNIGRSPAEIFAVLGEPKPNEQGIDGGFSSIEEPEYGERTLLPRVTLLVPEEEWVCYDIITDGCYTDSELKAFIAGRLHLIFKGVVLYRDHFRPENTHETRFCYTYSRFLDEYRPSGPPHYTKYT